MDGDIADQRRLRALLYHFVELVDHHVAELARAVLAMHHGRRIVDLGRIRHAQQRARARAHPDRLVVARPVHQVLIAGFFQQVGRGRIFVSTGTHPALGRFALVAGEGVGHVLDRARFIRFPLEVVQILGIGAAMGDDFVVAAADGVENLRRFFIQPAIGVMRGGQFHFVEHIEKAPDADAVAVVAPRIIAMGLRLAVLGVVVAAPLAERETFDIGRQTECETLATGPVVVLALGDRRVIVAPVVRQWIR